MMIAGLALAACAKSSAATSGGAPGISTRSIAGVGKVLVDSKGLTLYRLTTDTATTSSCSGACATAWPPLLEQGGKLPALASGLSGKLGTIKRSDGSVQVTYGGQPLYTYSGDSQPGQANGQGIKGVWFAVTASGSASASSSSDKGAGGYGY
jgi:predicted lipoprotein with Yx(FWY)xxD motif